MTSAKPRVVTSATRLPRPSSSALVATVVPCASSSGASPPVPACATAVRTAPAGSAGVDGTLTTRPSSVTRSVNVPPVSTPTRMGE